MPDYTYPDPRETKLPMWAQQTLAGLRSRLADAEERIADLPDAPDADTFLIIDWAWQAHPRRIAGKRQRVTAVLDGRGTEADRSSRNVIDLSLEGDRLVISAQHGGLDIAPRAGNVIAVRTRDGWS